MRGKVWGYDSVDPDDITQNAIQCIIFSQSELFAKIRFPIYQNMFVGTQKNHFNEMVLLITQRMQQNRVQMTSKIQG